MSITRILFGATMILAVACVPQAASDDDDDGGCQADVDCKGNRVCNDGECIDPGSATCDAVDESCEAESCCGDALCAQYSGDSGSFTVCEALCTLDAQCASGCCLPLGDSGASTCAPAEYCMGGIGGSPPSGIDVGGAGPGPGMGGSPGMGGTGGEAPQPGS